MTATLPPPPPPPPPPPGWSGRPAPTPRPLWLPPLASVIAIVFLASVFTAVVRSVDAGADHPGEWDPRVADLAAFVERARDLDFDHPVHVDFLTPAEYTAATTADEADVPDEAREELRHYEGVLRAMGVASGALDLLTAYNQVADGGTLAFYDPAERRVRVRGTNLTVGLRVTLVHELTHALQDQHFDLERIYGEELDSSEALAFRGLVEGDALRIEDLFVEQELSQEEQADYDEEYAGELSDSEAATSDVPPFVNAGFGVPYLLGHPLVLMLANEGGNGAVDDALRDPPTTEEHLFDPASYLADESGEELDLELDDGIEVLDEGPFGSPSWYLLLAEHLDPKVAFDAALGWAGDHYATFEDGDADCVQAAFAGDDEDDERAMRDALAAWVGELPDGMAEVLEVGGHPGFRSCDPGTTVDIGPAGRSQQALLMPSLWGFLIADAATVVDADRARCYAREVIDALTYEEISDPEGAIFGSDRFEQVATAAFETCA